jgi:hypothetical protein
VARTGRSANRRDLAVQPAVDHPLPSGFNQRPYASIGYEETGRGNEAGYDRVFMRKQLAD